MTVHNNLRKYHGNKPFKLQLQPEKENSDQFTISERYYSLAILLSNHFTHPIAKMIEFGSQTDSIYYLPKPSNFGKSAGLGHQIL